MCVHYGCDITSATRTLGTSLLTVASGPTWSFLSRNSHSYRRATKAGQTTLGQAKTVLSTSRILSQATKVRLRYKHVDFLRLMAFVPGEEEVALGCPGGLKCWLSQGGSQAFWAFPAGSKAFFWLCKGGSEALRPVPGGSKCHVPGDWLQMANCPMGVQA